MVGSQGLRQQDIVFLLSPQGSQPKAFAEYRPSLKMYSATHLPGTRAAAGKQANHKLDLLPIGEIGSLITQSRYEILQVTSAWTGR